MNWYKQANVELAVLSFGGGTLKVLVNGSPYTFGPLDDDFAEDLAKKIRYRPWEHGSILNLLKRKYNLNKMQDDTEEDKEQMLDQLYDEGHLTQ
jgi:hypothetical protein